VSLLYNILNAQYVIQHDIIVFFFSVTKPTYPIEHFSHHSTNASTTSGKTKKKKEKQ